MKPNKSETIGMNWFEKKTGIQLEKNGWPDCWGTHPDGRFVAVEIKYNGYLLTEEQQFIKDLLVKAGIHYIHLCVDKDYECKIVFDSDKHEI